MSRDQEIVATLETVTTATITTILLKKGLRNVWMRGTRPLNPGQPRLVGKAFTLRFVPAREDLATPESWSKPISTRAAIEAMPAGCIAVADAMGVTDAGIFGASIVAPLRGRGRLERCGAQRSGARVGAAQNDSASADRGRTASTTGLAEYEHQ